MSQTMPPAGPPRPSDEPATRERPTAPGPADRRRTTWLVVAVVAAFALMAALVAVLVWPDDDEDAETGATTTGAPATTAPETTATTVEPSTTAPPVTVPADASTAVFPSAGDDVRFDDPVAAARAFAADFVGFDDPVVGEFMQGDNRSGEVDVRPVADGPATTVLVRRLGDDTWWVLGAVTADIALDAPAAGEAVTSPVALSGRALAFEGHVAVEVREDGNRRPIGTGFVTGGGDVMRPFAGEVAFSAPSADRGALVLLSLSAEDGRVWTAATVRVAFG